MTEQKANQFKTMLINILSEVVPYVNGHISTLGGENHCSTMLVFSLDKKEDWAHGILENSRYARVHIHETSKGYEIEFFSVARSIGAKFRKSTVKDENKVIEKFNKLAEKLKELL